MENDIKTPPASTNPSPPNNFKYFLITVVVIFVIFVIGIGGYLLGQKSNQQKEQPVTQINQPSLTSTQIPTQEPSIAPTTPTPTIDETSILKQAIKDTLVAEHGSQANSLNITVSKIQGDYASGGASEQGGGAMWFAAKTNGVWKLVWDGNGVILCSSLTSYPNFPTDMISECWNDKTQQSVKR